MPDTPDNIARFVDVLGVDLTVQLFLAVGGTKIYLPYRSSAGTPAARAIGPEPVQRLAKAFGHGWAKVPLARRWIAMQLRAQGKSTEEIARTIRADAETVRRWDTTGGTSDQLDLF